MKIIFLDIDGVLATPDSYDKGRFFILNNKLTKAVNGFTIGDNWFHGLDDKAIINFNKIQEASGARIVISSTWRKGDEEYFSSLINYLKICGVKGRVIDRTPELRGLGPDRSLNNQRGDEIKDWLSNHPEVTHFVVLDDDADMDAVKDNFVHLSDGWSSIDKDGVWHSGKGIEDVHVEKAKEILEWS